MTSQAELPFPRARAADPSTSKAAAARVRVKSQGWLADALRYLEGGAATADEICVGLNIPPRRWPSVKTALSRAKSRGLVEWTGWERDGQNVWRLTRP